MKTNIDIMFAENNEIGLLNEAIKNDPELCPNDCGSSYRGIHHKGFLNIYPCGVNSQYLNVHFSKNDQT